jgi:hypothetical protein
MLIVDNLFANIERGAIELQGFLNGDDGAIDASTISTRRSY